MRIDSMGRAVRRAAAQTSLGTIAVMAIAWPAASVQAPRSSTATAPSAFVAVQPSEVAWRPHPAVAGAQVAILVGSPQTAGPLVVRVKLPAKARIMPHTHPDARTYTVLAGEWKLGFGEKFDTAKLQTFAPGGLYRLPARVPHFQASGSVETIVQIESIGPTSTDFVNPADAPVKQ